MFPWVKGDNNPRFFKLNLLQSDFKVKEKVVFEFS